MTNARVRVDPTGVVHAAWTKRTLPVIIEYATNRTGPWVIETVASASALPSADVSVAHLALGDCGAPQVAYLRRHVVVAGSAVQQAYLATRNVSGWTEELIPIPSSPTDATPSTVVTSIDITTDSTGRTYAAARVSTSGGAFFLVRNSAGVWTSEYLAVPVEGLSVPVIAHHSSVGPVLAWGYAPTVAVKQGGTWVTSSVPGARPMKSSTLSGQPQIAVAVDDAGTISLAWGSALPDGSESLFVSKRTSSTWSSPVALQNASGWAANALTLWVDPTNRPRLSYEAYMTGGSVTPFWAMAEDDNWLRTPISTGGSGGAVATTDSTGRQYLLVSDTAGLKLRVQRCVSCSGGFCPTTVAAAGNVGNDNALAVGPSGNPVISYDDQTKADLKLARWSGTGWVRETVDEAGSVGAASSVAVDAQNNVHISYWDVTNTALKYARWTVLQGWTTETVDAAGEVGGFSSIAVDSVGQAHIGYFDLTNGDLKYAHQVGSSWVITPVDTVGDVGRRPSLALDGMGRPRIAYTDTTNRDLKFAQWTGSSWTIETVDAAGDVGQFASLALDTAGNPHISYFDATNGDLKYAARTMLGWSPVSVASTGTVGLGTSIALDATGMPHIAFNDSTGRSVKYIKRVGTAWLAPQTLDTMTSTCLSVSMALDSSGRAHVSYCDASRSDLKYARQ